MNRLLRLQEKYKQVRGEMTAILDAVEEGGDAFSDEQRASFDKLKADLEGIKIQIEAEKALRDSELEMEIVRDSDSAESEARESLLTDDSHPVDSVTPFKSFGDQLLAIKAAAVGQGIHQGLNDIQGAIQGASEGNPADGGFLVQQDFASQVLADTYETAILWNSCDDQPIGARFNGYAQNAVDETSRVTGSRWGGVQAYWDGEGDSATKSKPKFYRFELNLKKLRGLYYATEELLEDTTALSAAAGQAFSEEFGFMLDDGAYNGNGAGKPVGIIGHAGTVTVAKETKQAAATIISENIENMYSRMMAKYISGAVWNINQDCFPQLFKLQHVVGTGGVPVYLPAGGLSQAPFGSLLGRPVIPIEQAATCGTLGDISFNNWKQYKTISKGGMKTARSMHVEFLTGQEVFRMTLRTNGSPKRKSELTPYKGTKTQGPFVELAARA